jgi:hypothetical protein
MTLTQKLSVHAPFTDLPPLAQIGFVVPDMTIALAAFEPLFGRFLKVRYANHAYDYRGRKADCVVDVAFGFTGDVEVELIAPVSGEGPHSDFLKAGKSGMHHIQYRFANIDAEVARFRAHGYDCVWHKREAPDTAVAYMTHADFPLVIELVEPLGRVRPPKDEGVIG